MIGSQLGNYRVISRLGEGGMGTVYRATDTMLDRDVALKVLRPELARQASLVERFRAEAVALARLRHEHIAALYGLDRQGDELVMVMEFVSGETLEARLARLGPMNWQEAIPILRGVLAALGHAHVRGVVHRDIKPANVMVDTDGTVKVMDFGIARLMGENRQTRAGVAIGTPSYMAPEQLRGEDVDGRTDLYAAGALLFELLTGRVAFEADSDYALMMQQLNEPPRQPSTITPGVPRALDAAVARAMAKRPTQRFGTATDFSRALDEITSDTFSVAPIREAAAAVVAKAPRDWRVYVIAACVLAAIGIGAAAMRSTQGGETEATLNADPVRTADSVAAALAARVIPTAAEPTRQTGSTIAATPIAPGVSVTPIKATPVDAKPPVSTAKPQRPAEKPKTPVSVVPGEKVTTPEVVAPAATAKTPHATESRGDESESAIRSRLNDLANRCAASIASNDASRAGSLLSGDKSGIMQAINDSRIVSASAGNVSANIGDGRGEGSFSVQITWKRAFGGAKSTTARMTAEVSRSDRGWSASECRVSSDGGVG